MSEERLGEIIETSTVGFIAQSHALHTLPPLGRLVKVATPAGDGADEIYAVVAYGETAGVDAGRRPVRRGSEQIYDAAIYHEHPELVHLLRTVFQARIVGYVEEDRPRRYLPPVPPPLHFSVRACTAAEVAAFTDDLLYLRILLTPDGLVSPEQLLAAHIRSSYVARGGDRAWLDAAGREVARLFKDEYDRLLTVLQSIDPDGSPAATGLPVGRAP
jgi:hypothetical protein